MDHHLSELVLWDRGYSMEEQTLREINDLWYEPILIDGYHRTLENVVSMN